MLIQVVGLPCSGKSTALKNLKRNFVFCHYDKYNRTDSIFKEVLNSLKENQTSIIESACGYSIPESIVVLLKVPSEQLAKNRSQREYSSSVKDDEQISYKTIPADYTVYSTEDLEKLISILIKG